MAEMAATARHARSNGWPAQQQQHSAAPSPRSKPRSCIAARTRRSPPRRALSAGLANTTHSLCSIPRDPHGRLPHLPLSHASASILSPSLLLLLLQPSSPTSLPSSIFSAFLTSPRLVFDLPPLTCEYARCHANKADQFIISCSKVSYAQRSRSLPHLALALAYIASVRFLPRPFINRAH